jgi:hypothetical protein
MGRLQSGALLIRLSTVIGLVMVALFGLAPSSAASPGARPDGPPVRLARPGQTELSFIKNQGQVDPRVEFYLPTPGQVVWVTRKGIVFDLRRETPGLDRAVPPGKRGLTSGSRPPKERLVFIQELIGAHDLGRVEPGPARPGVYNYFIGDDPTKWRTGVRAYADVVHRDVWPGIDLKLYGNGRALEQEFVVRAGADPSRVQVAYRGIDRLAIAPDGSLRIRTAFGELHESVPRLYQEIAGKRVAVAGRYKLLSATSYGFEVGPYDRAYALVIDPTLTYSTYLGGTGGDAALSIALDASGSAYVTGSTTSTDFPVTIGPLKAPAEDVFVSKLTPAGNGLVYATFIGGNQLDEGTAIAVDTSGNAYVVGHTTSTNFPTVAPFGSQGGMSDAFVTKLDASGAIAYSSYLGGSSDDVAHGVAVDAAGAAYVTGHTFSSDFPTSVGAFQPVLNCGTTIPCVPSGASDAFVTKIDAGGTGIAYSTFLGGGANDVGWAIAVDATGQAHVSGETASFDFAPGAGGIAGGIDAFAVKLSDVGWLMWATFFGGTFDDFAYGVAVDSLGMVYLTGQTESPNLGGGSPIPYGGGIDAWVVKLNPFNHSMGYFSFLGGTGDSGGQGIVVDPLGNAYIAGYARGQFTTQGPALPGVGGLDDAFIASLGPSGALEFSGLLGGSAFDIATGIAVDRFGAVSVSGFTRSSDFPTAGPPYDGTFNGPTGGTDAFVAKLTPPATVTINSAPNPSTVGQNVDFTVTASIGGSPAANGVVRLYDDTFLVRTQTLTPADNGQVVLTYAVPSLGSHTMTAYFAPTSPSDLVSHATMIQTVVGGGGTTTAALTAPLVVVPSAGSSGPQPIGDIRLAESAGGTLQTSARIEVTLPSGLTFAALPKVTVLVGHGLQLVAVGVEAPRLEPGNDRFSFRVQTPSSGGPAVLLISGMAVIVPSTFGAGPHSTAVAGPGVTAASVTNITAVLQSTTPSLATVSSGTVGRGADDFTIVLTGVNFAPGATVSFSRGGVPATDVTVVSITVDSASQITITLDVSASATLGAVDVTVSNPGGGSVLLADAVSITAAPTVTGTLPTPVLRTGLRQSVRLTGSDFLPPTQSPPNIEAAISGTGITVENVSFHSATEIVVDVVVAVDAPMIGRTVTVTNPDGGTATSGPVLVLSDPTSITIVGLGPKSQPTPPPTQPTIASINPPSARRGTPVQISGEGFSSVAAQNSVTFTGAAGTKVTVAATVASVNASAADTLTVTVPSGAVDGPVVVGVNGPLSNALPFGVTDPALSAVVPRLAAVQGGTVVLDITGTKFAATSTVEFALSAGAPAGSVNGIITGGITRTGDTLISVSISIAANAFAGPRDVTVRNPDNSVSTRAQAFQIFDPTQVAFALAIVDTANQDISASFMPSVDATVTLGADGKCIAKTVTPHVVRLRATYIGSGAPPGQAQFDLAGFTSYLGTAINDDCEIDPLTLQRTVVASRDVALGPESSPVPPSVHDPASLTATASDLGGGTYIVRLWTYDWGASAQVRVSRTDAIAGVGTATFPVDADADTLPDAFEEATTLANVNATGAPVTELNTTAGGARVLDRLSATAGGSVKSAADGYTNFEKYRGLYLKGPRAGQAGALEHHVRLGAGQRHLFLRGHGFANDARLGAGQCGLEPPVTNRSSVNFSEWTPVADLSGAPCPRFEVGPAFANESIQVHDVSPAFAATTEFPRKSFQTGLSTADMGELAYDAYNCNGGEPCDHTSKTGPRNWRFWTYGVSAVGSATQYGVGARVLKKVVDSLFGDRPYERRTNDPARVVTDSAGNPMLAPLTVVADNSSGGSDNGLRDGTERVDALGKLLGDTYLSPVDYGKDFSVFDTNKDSCTELPLVTDPTTLTRCPDPSAATAPSPQATRQQVVRLTISHEVGHMIGASIYHSTNPMSVNYQFTNNWNRDNFFGPETAPELRIHNRGQQ